MLYPSIDELMEKVDSVYTLTIAVAKRARQLRDGSAPMVRSKATKEVGVALQEISDGKVVYERIKDGIK